MLEGFALSGKPVVGTTNARVLSEGDKRDSKGDMPERGGIDHDKNRHPPSYRGRGYFAPEPASRTRPRRTHPTLTIRLPPAPQSFLTRAQLVGEGPPRSVERVWWSKGSGVPGTWGWAGRVSLWAPRLVFRAVPKALGSIHSAESGGVTFLVTRGRQADTKKQKTKQRGTTGGGLLFKYGCHWILLLVYIAGQL